MKDWAERGIAGLVVGIIVVIIQVLIVYHRGY